MITRTYHLSENRTENPERFPDSENRIYLPALFGKLAWLEEKDPLFLDIETTGLSPRSSHLYQITVCHGSYIHQWFLDRPSQEKDMLSAFRDFLTKSTGPDTCLVTYNGASFDLPYLEKKASFYDLDLHLDKLNRTDLYVLLRPYRRFISPSSFKQKDLERYAGLNRRDPYSGRDLIHVYQQYLETASEESLNALLLHNLEDVTGMIELLPVLIWKRLFEGDFTCSFLSPEPAWSEQKSASAESESVPAESESVPAESESVPAESESVPAAQKCAQAGPAPKSCAANCTSVRLTLRIPASSSGLYMPAGLFSRICIPDHAYFSIIPASSDNIELILTIKGRTGELRHFLPDYKNYYYLTEEDSIVPRSLAQFVNSDFKRKAKASECFVRQSGFFLPQTRAFFHPEFQASYRSQPLYFNARQLKEANPDTIRRYILTLIGASLS